MAATRPRMRSPRRFDDFTTFDQRAHGDAVVGAAIVFHHHQILRHVDQTTGQVTRSSRSSAPCPPGPPRAPWVEMKYRENVSGLRGSSP